MKTLHMMIGLPRSGKSTIAISLGYPVVNVDAIRLAVYGTLWKAETEPLVWGIANTMVRALFITGHEDVVLDACNHTNERRQEWISTDWVQQFHLVPTTPDVCIQRAKDCGCDYLIPVIERMAAAWEAPGMSKDC